MSFQRAVQALGRHAATPCVRLTSARQGGRGSARARNASTWAWRAPQTGATTSRASTVGGVAALVTGAALATYAMKPAIELEGRPAWNERMKPRKKAPAPEVKEEVADNSKAEEALDKTAGVEDDAAPGEVDEQQSAYDPATGQINWDCPCLGGMAHGPCGEEFKAAFSCFVYSEAEPKGIDCVEKFKNMQDCFRRHPDVYAEEIEDDERAEEEAAAAAAASKQGEASGDGEKQE